MVTGGANLGRIGVITNRERHPGSFDVVHVKDSTGNSFATRLSNIFVIGKVRTPEIFSKVLNLPTVQRGDRTDLCQSHGGKFTVVLSRLSSQSLWCREEKLRLKTLEQ